MTLSAPAQMQKTLRSEISLQGRGLFTGESVSMKICPSPANTGIVFQRIDLPQKTEIPAHLDFVQETPRCTRLAKGDAMIYMVEHLLSALASLEIDNALIQLIGSEIPSGDGSAQHFVDLIEQVGLQEQTAKRRYLQIQEPLYWSNADVHLVALPAPSFRVSYTLHYPRSKFLGSQYFDFTLNADRYKTQIASCRTFSLYEEILPFIEKGLIKGGGLENALVIRGDEVLNPEGARFPDEPVRHKVLDLIGDFSLIGSPLLAHVISICSGHSSNVAFAKVLSKHAK